MRSYKGFGVYCQMTGCNVWSRDNISYVSRRFVLAVKNSLEAGKGSSRAACKSADGDSAAGRQ